MLHAVVTVLAAAAEHEEPSKTPFYLAGAVLALFAVAVSAVGIKRHETWPSSKNAARGLMALAAVLVAITMATAVITG